MTSLVATPDEIADALVNPALRQLWDLNIEKIAKRDDNSLDITYGTSSSKYHVTHVLLNHSQTYICQEHLRINGGQLSQTRLYKIEEVENRPYLVRVVLYVGSSSVDEARNYVKNLNSLRNFVGCENRPHQVVASLKVLKKPKTDEERYF